MDNQLDTYAAQYSAIISAEIHDNFLRGDIAQVVTEMHNTEREETGKSKIIDRFLDITGEARSTFNQYRWVAKIFSDDTLRHLPVTWTHYRVCAAVDEPDLWLKRAHDGKWSCSRLIEEIKAAKLDREIELGVECAHCHGTVSKEGSVTISHKRKRRILCSLECAQEHLKDMIADERSKEAANTVKSNVIEMGTSLLETIHNL